MKYLYYKPSGRIANKKKEIFCLANGLNRHYDLDPIEPFLQVLLADL